MSYTPPFHITENIANLTAEIAEQIGSISANVGVNENSILELIKSNPKITAKEVTLHLNLSLRQVERLLASMKKINLIAREGSDKKGEWKIIN